MAAMTSPAASAVPPPLCFERGFTLTELAIVVFIVALLIGVMGLPLSAQQDLWQRQETEQTLTEVREALYGFAIANGRLPRPRHRQRMAPSRSPIAPTMPIAQASSLGQRSAPNAPTRGAS